MKLLANFLSLFRVFILSSFLLFAAFPGCTKDKVDKDTYQYFSAHLDKNMNYDDLLQWFGNPDENYGSGILTYVYYLTDGTRIVIRYTNKIESAEHVDGNGVLLHTII